MPFCVRVCLRTSRVEVSKCTFDLLSCDSIRQSFAVLGTKYRRTRGVILLFISHVL